MSDIEVASRAEVSDIVLDPMALQPGDGFGLNWGCGPDVMVGWGNSDRDDYGQQHVGELLDGLPWNDETFDFVVANHSFQMLTYVQLMPGLAELARVLKTGGVIRILVQDMLRAITAWEQGETEWFPIVDEAETQLSGKLCAYLNWYSEGRVVFTGAWLAELLERAGFAARVVAPKLTFSEWPKSTALDKRFGESLVVEGVKR